MRVFILSEDEGKVEKIKTELLKALGQIGKVSFRQIDPKECQIAHEPGDSVSIFPGKRKRRKVEEAVREGVFSMPIIVVTQRRKNRVDMDTTFST